MSVSWSVGDVVEGLYEVRDAHAGGMGVVYRVFHLGWQTELAVKSPRRELFADAAGRQRFVDEAETWIRLGMHPHVCACHYVRVLDGVPRVFAQYVTGGSLSDHIDDRRLYAGGPAAALARIVDVAVQLAWGIDHAHRNGVIHQDIKPANVLLADDGTALVTDFGLARAGAATTTAGAGGNILVTGGGLTPAYASPEQSAGHRVGRRDDVWSFAVSVLEMFTGGVTWRHGAAAGEALAQYLRGTPDDGLPAMPGPLAALLGRCLHPDPDHRPTDLDEVATALRQLYAQVTGRPHPRPEPGAVDLRADELNNRALSWLDLGRVTDAETAFTEALRLDPRHLHATYNRGLTRWRRGEQTDVEIIDELGVLLADTAASEEEVMRLAAGVHLERADYGSALHLLSRLEPAFATQIHQTITDRQIPGYELRETPLAGGRSVCGLGGFELLVGSLSGVIVGWSVEHRALRRRFTGHRGPVTAVATAPGSEWAVSGGADGTVRWWHLVGPGEAAFRVHHCRGPVDAVAVSADGVTGVGASDSAVWVWHRDRRKARHVLTGHAGTVLGVAVSADGRTAVSAGADGTVRGWDLGRGTCLNVLDGHAGAVTAVALTPDGRTAVSAGADGTLRVWDLRTGACTRVLTGHRAGVGTVVVTPDGGHALSGGADETLRRWDLATGRCLHTLFHQGPAVSIGLDPGGEVAYSVGADGATHVWQVGDTGVIRAPTQLSVPTGSAALAAMSQREEELLRRGEAALDSGDLTTAHRALTELRGLTAAPLARDAWRRLAARAERTAIHRVLRATRLGGHTGPVTAVAAHPDARHAATADRTEIRIWELDTGRPSHVLGGHGGEVTALAYTPDGATLVSGGADGAVRQWHPDGSRPDRVVATLPEAVHDLAVGPDASQVLCGTDSGLRVLDLGTGRLVRTLTDDAGPVRAVAFSPDGGTGVAGCQDGTLRVWDLATGLSLLTMDEGWDAVTAVRVSVDGRHVTSGHADSTVHYWDLHTGRCMRIGPPVGKGVTAVALDTSGWHVVSARVDVPVVVWRVAEDPVSPLPGPTGGVQALDMTVDGRYVVGGDRNRDVWVWELDWELSVAPRRASVRALEPMLEAFVARFRAGWSEREVDGLMRLLGHAGLGDVSRQRVVEGLAKARGR